MGLVLIEVEDEVDEDGAAIIAEHAQKLFGKDYKTTRWYWNTEDEHKIVELMERSISELGQM